MACEASLSLAAAVRAPQLAGLALCLSLYSGRTGHGAGQPCAGEAVMFRISLWLDGTAGTLRQVPACSRQERSQQRRLR